MHRIDYRASWRGFIGRILLGLGCHRPLPDRDIRSLIIMMTSIMKSLQTSLCPFGFAQGRLQEELPLFEKEGRGEI